VNAATPPRGGPVSSITLRCTVRGCARTLARSATALACTAGHTFDVAREGYVNLLQPQDRRSREAGDSAGALEARGRVWRAGLCEPLARRVEAELEPGARIADVGCGSGELLGRVALDRAAVGIDLSVHAVRSAAREFPGLAWVVANADRGLPLADHSIDVLLSITATRHPAEFRRVLVPGGRLVVAVPAADDLVELREALLGEASHRGRAEFWIERLAPSFELRSRERVGARRLVEPELLADLARATYRAGRGARAEKLATIGALEVTLAFEVLVWSC
jgi:23S rRNA (guanine745-N1)-methyltransferase